MSARLLAAQLGRPSKLAGRWILAPVWNRRNVALNDAALARLALKPDDRVLEVGFGGGYLLDRIAAAVTAGAVAGVDASEAMVAYSRRHLQRWSTWAVSTYVVRLSKPCPTQQHDSTKYARSTRFSTGATPGKRSASVPGF